MVVQKQQVSTRERTAVWVLEKVIDGHYMPEAYFGTVNEANAVLEQILVTGYGGRDKWRVSEKDVWMEARFYLDESTSHIARWVRQVTDPEYAEYQRLHEKFKAVWK